MINDGNYYLLAYNNKRLGAWRVDRIKEVTPTGEPRDCDEEFKALDLSNYSQCNFGMMINTKKMRVKLICDGSLLDTMVDRFGSKGIFNWVDGIAYTVNKQLHSWREELVLFPDQITGCFHLRNNRSHAETAVPCCINQSIKTNGIQLDFRSETLKRSVSMNVILPIEKFQGP